MLPPEYFPDHELRCHCGCGLLPPRESVERLYALRILLRTPLPVSSAARCWRGNKHAGGKGGSVHLPEHTRLGLSKLWGGGAFDIVANADLQIQIIACGLKCGFIGFGLADTYIHIDDATRPKLTYWRYPT